MGRERIDVGPETSQRRARGPDEEATRRAYFPAAGGGERKGAGSRRACVPRGAQGGRARARRASRHSPVRVGSAAASHGSLSRNTSLHAGPSASRYPAVGPCVLASRGAATWYIPDLYSSVTPSSVRAGAARGLLIARGSAENESRPQEFDWSNGTVCDWRIFWCGRKRAKQTVIRGVEFNQTSVAVKGFGCRRSAPRANLGQRPLVPFSALFLHMRTSGARTPFACAAFG